MWIFYWPISGLLVFSSYRVRSHKIVILFYLLATYVARMPNDLPPLASPLYCYEQHKKCPDHSFTVMYIMGSAQTTALLLCTSWEVPRSPLYCYAHHGKCPDHRFTVSNSMGSAQITALLLCTTWEVL